MVVYKRGSLGVSQSQQAFKAIIWRRKQNKRLRSSRTAGNKKKGLFMKEENLCYEYIDRRIGGKKLLILSVKEIPSPLNLLVQ